MHGSGPYNVRNTGALDTVVRFYFSFSTWWWLLAVNLDQNLHRRLNYLRSMPHQNAALPSKQRQRLYPPCIWPPSETLTIPFTSVILPPFFLSHLYSAVKVSRLHSPPLPFSFLAPVFSLKFPPLFSVSQYLSSPLIFSVLYTEDGSCIVAKTSGSIRFLWLVKQRVFTVLLITQLFVLYPEGGSGFETNTKHVYKN